MNIRRIRVEDAHDFLHLCYALDKETKFMMLEEDERKTTLDEQMNSLKTILEENRSLLLVCEIEGKLVGYLSATREDFRRINHSAYIVVGVLQEYSGHGIGSHLFEELEAWAKLNNIHRLELTVMTHNEAGIHLYKKMGFEIEGCKKHSLMVDGEYVDEYYMAKLI